jgi:hypothetical protein
MPDDDDSWWDEPYSHADMLKPGFDPYEAHLAWCRERAKPETIDEARARIRRARMRVGAALRALKAAKPVKPRKPKAPNEAARWRKALKEIRKRKR